MVANYASGRPELPPRDIMFGVGRVAVLIVAGGGADLQRGSNSCSFVVEPKED